MLARAACGDGPRWPCGGLAGATQGGSSGGRDSSRPWRVQGGGVGTDGGGASVSAPSRDLGVRCKLLLSVARYGVPRRDRGAAGGRSPAGASRLRASGRAHELALALQRIAALERNASTRWSSIFSGRPCGSWTRRVERRAGCTTRRRLRPHPGVGAAKSPSGRRAISLADCAR